MNVRQRHKKLRVRRKAALPRFPLPPLLAAGMAAGLRDRLLLRCERRVAGFFRTGAFVFAKRHGWRIVWRLAAGIMHLVRLWLCIFAAVDVVSWLFADPRRFRCQRFSVRLYGGCFFALRRAHAFALSCVAVGLPGVFLVPALFLLGVLCAQMSVRLMEQRRGRRLLLRRALFPGTGVGVLPAAWRLRPRRAMPCPFFTKLIL